MNELYKLTTTFEDNLDRENIIKSLKASYDNIKKDKSLIADIKDYKKTNNERKKRNIINNNNYITAKHYEAELNYIILEINKHLKTITSESDI